MRCRIEVEERRTRAGLRWEPPAVKLNPTITDGLEAEIRVVLNAIPVDSNQCMLHVIVKVE